MVKKKELNPKAIEYKKFDISEDDLLRMSETINKMDIDVSNKEDKSETFYKIAIEKLFDNENIETKTEFLNAGEVFSATKLQFLGKFADIPMLSEFVSALERKRISLNRKGREEIVLSLQERKQEELEIQKAQMNHFRFGQ